MSLPRFAPVALCLALLLGTAVPVHAAWRELLPEARLIGAGEMRWFGLALYGAQLWSPTRSPGGVASLRVPFALQLSYRRSISREALVEASLAEIRRLAPRPLEAATLQAWEREMQQAFVDVRDGDQICGVFLPDQGARFYVGSQLQHVVSDPAFARAFFAIWLDPRTRNPELRAQLLGSSPL